MNITELSAQVRHDVKNGGPLADRQYRIKVIEKFIEDNPSANLEKLADLILHEELTDTDRMKMRNNEYPIMSNEQLARRQEGFHSRGKTVSGEVPFEAAETVGVDGRSYGRPTRRPRNTRENKFVDKEAKIRNKERKQRYTEFTRVQPVYTSFLE